MTNKRESDQGLESEASLASWDRDSREQGKAGSDVVGKLSAPQRRATLVQLRCRSLRPAHFVIKRAHAVVYRIAQMFTSATDAIQSQKLTTSLNKTPPPLGDHLVRLVPWCCSIASGYSNGPTIGPTYVTHSKYLYSIFYCNWSFFLYSLSFSLASCFVVAHNFTLHNPWPQSELILLPQTLLWLPFVYYRITSTEAKQKK